MKRIRQLLLKILRHLRDNNGNGGFPTPPDFSPEYSRVQVDYHIQLCQEAGWARSMELQCENGEIKTALALTWEGHNELERN